MNVASPIQSVFHPTDFSLASEVAFICALKIALAAKAELSVIHYAEQGVVTSWDYFPKVREILANWDILSPGCSESELTNLGLRVEGMIATGPDACSSLVQHLNQKNPDLMVLATHQIEGLNRWLETPVAEPLAREARCPTIFVPPFAKERVVSYQDGTVTLERILIPVTRVIPPQLAIDYAVNLAKLLDVNTIEWKIFHVGKKEDIPALYLPTHEGWKWEKLARPGHPVDQLLEMAAEFSPQLIVMMTEGHRGLFDVLQGSTTERIVRGVRCPVLAVPVVSPDE
ncbi:MAG: universal stress protein [Nitrospirota bacterium]|nr:universal stress protein [Nitrospirota bacterium]